MPCVRRLVAPLLLALLVPLGPAVPAHATPGTGPVSCTGHETNVYTPPLTATPRTTTVDVESFYSTCLAPGNEQIVPGHVRLTVTVPQYSCVDVLSTARATQTIQWADGSTTTYDYLRTVTNIAGTLVLTNTGTVTAGRFTGAAVLRTATGPSLDPLTCLGSGYTHRDYAITLQILP